MPWPPPAPVTGYIAKGVTTIVWGTDGIATQSGAPFNQYIVKSARPAERNEEARVENGTGLTATEILLKDGYDYEITVVDDSTIVPPVGGQIVSLINPLLPGNSSAPTAPIPFEVINNSYSIARKQDGERVLLCRAFALFPAFTQISAPAAS